MQQELKDSTHVVFMCDKLLHLSKILKNKLATEELKTVAEIYREEKEFLKAYNLFNKLFKETFRADFKYAAVKCILSAGEISLGLSESEEYFKYLNKIKSLQKIMSFLNEERNLFSDEEKIRWELHTLLSVGDRQGLDGFWDKLTNLSPEFRGELISIFLLKTTGRAKYWHASIKSLKYILNEIKENSLNMTFSKKRIAKLMIDSWLLLEKDHDLFATSLVIAEKIPMPVFGEALSRYLGEMEKADYFYNLAKERKIRLGELDFGDDLFNSNESLGEKEKLIKNIEFLLKLGKENEVYDQIKKLETIDPKHILVIDYKRKLDVLSKSGEERSTGLLNRKTSYIDESEVKSFEEIAKYYSKEFIQKNYEDIIIAFNLLNLPTVALKVIERIETSELSERENINLKYLKCETLFKNESYFEVRDLCLDLLGTLPLLKEEMTAIEYILAESYYCLGRQAEALALFRKIHFTTKRYRLTEERIKEIAKN